MEHSILNEYISSFKNAEEKGIGFFFKEYYPALCLYANKLIKDKPVAEEIASEAFIKISRHCDQFDNALQIKAYLLTIVRNQCYKWLSEMSNIRKKEREFFYVMKEETDRSHFEAIIAAELVADIY